MEAVDFQRLSFPNRWRP